MLVIWKIDDFINTFLLYLTFKEEDKDFLYHIQEGDIENVTKYLESNPELASKLCEDLYPIHWAADRGNAEMVQVLLKFG